MADQLGSGAVAGVTTEGGQLSQASTEWTPPEPFHGRTVSWVAVSLIMAAFLIGDPPEPAQGRALARTQDSIDDYWHFSSRSSRISWR